MPHLFVLGCITTKEHIEWFNKRLREHINEGIEYRKLNKQIIGEMDWSNMGGMFK